MVIIFLLQSITKTSPAAKKALIRVAMEIVQQELKDLNKRDSIFKQAPTVENIKKFTWKKVESELQATTPVTNKLITAAMTPKR